VRKANIPAKLFSAVVLAATALMAAPSGAGAATTIGETFTPNSCAPYFTVLQVVSPGNEYAAPADGVITRWSFQATATNVPQLKFKVGRPVGGTDFTMIGESGGVTPAPSTVNSYFVRIPVQAGDVIGLYAATFGHCDRQVSGFEELSHVGDIVPPTTATFVKPDPYQMDVSALLESDCDKDGFGDETQDQNLSSCAPGTTPGTAPGTAPTLPSGAPATCRGVQATIVGTEGSDVRTGSQGRDVIVALGGHDTLSGLGGNDVICGGPGKDSLKGEKGKDSLLGQKGKDALKGGPSRDFCKGGKGNDTASGCEIEKSI
jgi:hypothetical protein